MPSLEACRWSTQPPCGTPIDSGHDLATVLLAAWACNEGAGPTLYDAFGLHHATINYSNGGWTTSVGAGGAITLNFDGYQTYATVADSPDLSITGPLTVAAWLATTQSSRPVYIYSSYLSVSPYSGFAFRLNNGNPSFLTDTKSWIDSPTTVSDGRPHHVAVVLDATATVSFYIDGTLTYSAASAFPSAYSGPRYLGSNDGASYSSFDGPLFGLGLWGRALEGGEVFALANDPWAMYQPPRRLRRYVAAVATGRVRHSCAGHAVPGSFSACYGF